MEEAGLEPVGGKTSVLDDARRKRQEARRIEAMSLLIAGLTPDQIGEKMQISASAVKALVNRTLERAHNRNVDTLREIENQRLDRAQASIWTKVIGGDLKAIDTFLRISAQRARVNGLNAPTNINLNLSIKQEMEAALNELHEVVMGEVIEDDDRSDRPGDGDGDYLEVEGPSGSGD